MTFLGKSLLRYIRIGQQYAQVAPNDRQVKVVRADLLLLQADVWSGYFQNLLPPRPEFPAFVFLRLPIRYGIDLLAIKTAKLIDKGVQMLRLLRVTSLVQGRLQLVLEIAIARKMIGRHEA